MKAAIMFKDLRYATSVIKKPPQIEPVVQQNDLERAAKFQFGILRGNFAYHHVKPRTNRAENFCGAFASGQIAGSDID